MDCYSGKCIGVLHQEVLIKIIMLEQLQPAMSWGDFGFASQLQCFQFFSKVVL
jgi:hypothetical protein